MGKHIGYTFFWRKGTQRDSLSVQNTNLLEAEQEFLRMIDCEPDGYTPYNLYLCEHGRLWPQIGDFTGCSCHQLIED